MVGIVTRTDVVRQMAFCQGCGCTAAAATVMTKDVHVAQYLADHERAEAFARPIIDEDLTPLGVINARDAFLVLLEGWQYEEGLLRDYVMGIGCR